MNISRGFFVAFSSLLGACVTGAEGTPAAMKAPEIAAGQESRPLLSEGNTLSQGGVYSRESSHLPRRHRLDDVERAKAREARRRLPKVDFKLTTASPVTADEALFAASWTTSSPTDQLFFGMNGPASKSFDGARLHTAANFYALTNLHSGGPPTLQWTAALAGDGLDGSAVMTSIDGTQVFTIDTTGTLSCFQGATGVTCSGWTNYVMPSCGGLNGTSGGVHGGSGWIDWASTGGSGDIYFGDACGFVQRVNGTTGALVWRIQPGAPDLVAAIEDGALVYNGIIYPTEISSFSTCSAIGEVAPCPGFAEGVSPSPWAVQAGTNVTYTTSYLYAVANDYAFEFSTEGALAQTASSPVYLDSGGDGNIMRSGPTVDGNAEATLYTSFNNDLLQISIPFGQVGAIPVLLSPFAELNSGSLENSSAPLAYAEPDEAEYIYAGDSAGFVERYDCAGAATGALVDGVTSANGGQPPATGSSYGSRITTDPLLDGATGNVYFGFTNPSGGGGLVQYPLGDGYQCPEGEILCTDANECGAGVSGDSCVTGTCCTDADCDGGTCQNNACAP
jgi:hypothetical protein